MMKLFPLFIGISVSFILYYLLREEKSFLQKRIQTTGKKYQNKINKILTNLSDLIKPLSKKSTENIATKAKIKLMLMQAGLPSAEDDILEFENRKLINFLIMGALAVLILIVSFNVYTLGAGIVLLYLGYKIPEVKINRLINIRKKDLSTHLADALDMLAICVEAGLSLDAAVYRVGEEFKTFSPTIHQEFKRLNRDITSGISRQEAYRAMSTRVENKELQSFIALLIQTDKLGTSISHSLRVYCDSVRTRKRQAIEELSQNASSKMTIPMIAFMLPAMFIIILYPAAVKIMEGMAQQ